MRIVSSTWCLTKVYVPRYLTLEELVHCMLHAESGQLKKCHENFTYLIIYLHKISSSSKKRLATTAAMCKITNTANRIAQCHSICTVSLLYENLYTSATGISGAPARAFLSALPHLPPGGPVPLRISSAGPWAGPIFTKKKIDLLGFPLVSSTGGSARKGDLGSRISIALSKI
jgi:hypothetical protein